MAFSFEFWRKTYMILNSHVTFFLDPGSILPPPSLLWRLPDFSNSSNIMHVGTISRGQCFSWCKSTHWSYWNDTRISAEKLACVFLSPFFSTGVNNVSLRYKTNYCRHIALSQRKDSEIQVGSARRETQAQYSAQFWETIFFQLSFFFWKNHLQ